MDNTPNTPNNPNKTPVEEGLAAVMAGFTPKVRRTMAWIAVTINLIMVVVFCYKIDFVPWRDVHPLAWMRSDYTEQVTFVRMEPPAHRHYRLITDDGRTINYDEHPRAFVELINHGFPYTTTVRLRKEDGYPVVRTFLFPVVTLGIHLALLVLGVQFVRGRHGTTEETTDNRRRFMRNRLIAQCLLLLVGNWVIAQWMVWSPWLLVGLGPIAANAARFSKRMGLTFAVWGVFFMMYPVSVAVQALAPILLPGEEVIATPVTYYEEERHEEVDQKSARWGYDECVYSSLLSYPWKGKTRYFYTELEELLRGPRKYIRLSYFQQDIDYIKQLKTKRLPLVVRTVAGTPVASLPKRILKERQYLKKSAFLAVFPLAFALITLFLYRSYLKNPGPLSKQA